MDYNVIAGALIQAGGAVVAAVITVIFAGKIVKENVGAYFHTYSDKSHSVRTIMQKAQRDIFVVTAVGNKFLGEYEELLNQKLNSGVHVRYMLLDSSRFQEMEQYLHGEFAKDIQIHDAVKTKLESFKAKYPTLFDFRYFHGYMTASYVGVDIWPDSVQVSGLLQVMLYQYHVRARNSPIMEISPKTDEKSYITTVNSIKDMWRKADEND